MATHHKAMTITYSVKGGIYVNMTNRCPCACTFCLRRNGDGVYGSDSLWLEREPTVDEVMESLLRRNLGEAREIVFCGYGEPTERLGDLLDVAARLKSIRPDIRIRVNTNGLSDLVNGRPTAADFAGRVDSLSISLNTDDANEYLALCRPKFGVVAYAAMLKFAETARDFVPEVVMTVVGEPVTPRGKQDRCRAICDRLGVRFRVRPYEP